MCKYTQICTYAYIYIYIYIYINILSIDTYRYTGNISTTCVSLSTFMLTTPEVGAPIYFHISVYEYRYTYILYI